MRNYFALMLLVMLPFSTLSAERAPRVVGGSDASISDAPWQAFVRIGSFYCGGVVIASDWVLTAAHCLDTADDDENFSLASADSVSVYVAHLAA